MCLSEPTTLESCYQADLDPHPPSDLDRKNGPLQSKSARKKALKAERYAALKLSRRAREKEAKKEKKRLLAEKRAAGELNEHQENINESNTRKRARIDGKSFGGRVVVDLGFDNMMNEKEITSLCSQLAYTYSANRRAGFPFNLVYTSLNGRTFTRLEEMNNAGYKRWAKTEWWHGGYESLWEAGGGSKEVAEGSVKENLVYLTADSEQELTELKEHETYIIGGICDHNRYKNLCLDKANTSGISSARLPIGRYLASLPTRKVLTVNQVFEILIYWVETRDWEQSLYAVVPKRKFLTVSKHVGCANGEDGDQTIEGTDGEIYDVVSVPRNTEILG